MDRQVALLRGVNVGKHNRIVMADWRAVLTDLGFGRVRTHLNSGNAAFDASTEPRETQRIVERAIADRLDCPVPVLVRNRGGLARIVRHDPLAGVATDPARTLVIFLSAAPDPEQVRAVSAAATGGEVAEPGEREIHLWCPEGLRGARMSHAFWERRLGVTATGRNANTVAALYEMSLE